LGPKILSRTVVYLPIVMDPLVCMRKLSLSLTHTHTHTQIFLSPSLAPSLSLSLSLSLPPSLSLSLSPSLSFSLSLPLFLFLSLSLSRFHTHTHTHTHAHTHTRTEEVLSWWYCAWIQWSATQRPRIGERSASQPHDLRLRRFNFFLYDDDCFYYHSWRNNVVIAFGNWYSIVSSCLA